MSLMKSESVEVEQGDATCVTSVIDVEQGDKLEETTEENNIGGKKEEEEEGVDSSNTDEDVEKADSTTTDNNEEDGWYEVVIIGAGPHSLALVARLLENFSDKYTDQQHKTLHRQFQDQSSFNSTPISKKIQIEEVVKNKRLLVIDRSNFEEPNNNKNSCTASDNQQSNSNINTNSAGWMVEWMKNFSALQISHLRSPLFLHPDPFDVEALRAFIYKNHFQDQLVSIDHIFEKNIQFPTSKNKKKKKKKARRGKKKEVFNRRDTSLYLLPPLPPFLLFSHQLLLSHNLLPSPNKSETNNTAQPSTQAIPSSLLVSDKVVSIEPIITNSSTSDDSHCDGLVLKLASGKEVKARKVIASIGSGQIKRIPDWAKTSITTLRATENQAFVDSKIVHVKDIIAKCPVATLGKGDLTSYSIFPQEMKAIWRSYCNNKRVLIVGGGLTSAHLAKIACSHDADSVDLICRHYFRTQQFDVGLFWIGKFRRTMLARFWSEDFPERLEIIREARKGGSITPEIMTQLNAMKDNEDINFNMIPNMEVSSATWSANCWQVTFSDGSNACYDVILLATGLQVDVHQEKLFSKVLDKFPIPTYEGFPAINIDLQWHKDCPLYLLGHYAALQLGPDALNLSGARSGAERLADQFYSDIRDSEESSEEEATSSFVGRGINSNYFGALQQF